MRKLSAESAGVDHELHAFRRILHIGNACFFRKTLFNFFDAADPHCGDRILGKFKGSQPQVLSHFSHFWSAASICFDLYGHLRLFIIQKAQGDLLFPYGPVDIDSGGVAGIYYVCADCAVPQQQVLSVLLHIGHNTCSGGQLFGEKLCWEHAPSKHRYQLLCGAVFEPVFDPLAGAHGFSACFKDINELYRQKFVFLYCALAVALGYTYVMRGVLKMLPIVKRKLKSVMLERL